MDFSWFSAYRYGDLESVHPPEKRSAFVMQLLQPFDLSLVESRCLLLPDTIDLSKNAAYGLLKNEGALEVLLSDGPTATAEFHRDRMTEMDAIGRFAEYGHSHAGFAESIHRLVAEGKEAEAEKIVASIPELAELLPLLKRNRFFYFGR